MDTALRRMFDATVEQMGAATLKLSLAGCDNTLAETAGMSIRSSLSDAGAVHLMKRFPGQFDSDSIAPVSSSFRKEVPMFGLEASLEHHPPV